VIGIPCLESATINLENGKKFIIKVENYSEINIYISKGYLNGEILNRTFIKHDEIVKGGELKFIMSSVPNKQWGSEEEFYPYSLTE
jgi:putative alpha-1,2-mannosidase